MNGPKQKLISKCLKQTDLFLSHDGEYADIYTEWENSEKTPTYTCKKNGRYIPYLELTMHGLDPTRNTVDIEQDAILSRLAVF